MKTQSMVHPSTAKAAPAPNQCLILAAGYGRRLMTASGGSPKPLVQLQGKSLLEHVIFGAHRAGITDFVVVIGYEADLMRRWFAGHSFPGISVTIVGNSEYDKDNGVSVLKARNYLRDNFLLLMADHVFETSTACALLHERIAPDEVILAVDPKIDRVFDLDDATKVERRGDRIVAIGKQLKRYDAFDTGMFLCTPNLFKVLDRAKIGGNCSLSDGMRLLGQSGKLRAFDIGDATWQDVDTPEALAYAEATFSAQFCGVASAERELRA
jgi:choline kinase